MNNARISAFTNTLAAISLLTSAATYANPPYTPDLTTQGNRWLITAYNDASPVHTQWATQGICFYPTGFNGTHQQYAWVSDTFPNWNGRAVQEGDQVFMHGDYATDIGHDGMTWELTTVSSRDTGFGHWEEWREDARLGRTIGFANTRLVRVGKCEFDTYEEAMERYKNIGYKENNKGELIVTPYGLSESELEELSH